MLSLCRPSLTRALWQCSRPVSTTSTRGDQAQILAQARAVFNDRPPPPHNAFSTDPLRALALGIKLPSSSPPDRPLSAVEQAALQDQKNRRIYAIPPERDPILHFLTNKIMKHGRYSRAQKEISQMLLHIHTMTRSPPLPIVHEAVLKASPAVRVASSKRGGRVVMRPLPLSERQRTSLGLKWIIEASHDRPGMQRGLRLAKEMVALVKGESSALENKKRLHMAGMLARGNLKV